MMGLGYGLLVVAVWAYFNSRTPWIRILSAIFTILLTIAALYELIWGHEPLRGGFHLLLISILILIYYKKYNNNAPID
ncbi:MAG: hypothetical protein AAF571_10925 [Verrucomicrobiota bacterium]